MENIPQVFIIVATSLDGYIAQAREQSSVSWASKEDNQFFHQKTKEAGVIVMGSTTFKTINSKYLPLAERLNVVYSSSSNEELINELKIDKEKVNEKNLMTTTQSPSQLVNELGALGYEQIVICGGSSIYTQFLQSGLVNKIYVTVEPIIFGDGIKLFNHSVVKKMRLLSSKKLNDGGTLLLEYELIKESPNDS